VTARFAVVPLLVLLGIVAAACGTAEVPSRQPQLPTGGTIVVALAGELGVLDPHLAQDRATLAVAENVFDTLVELDGRREPSPGLASDWEVSEDLLTWSFTLEEGVEFHDGRPLEVDDVVASLRRIASDGLGAPGLGDVADIRARDGATVEIELHRPAGELLGALAAAGHMAIVPADAIADGSLDRAPVGTGPFRFVRAEGGVAVHLEANSDYWGDGPYIDGAEIRSVTPASVRLPDLRTGDIDLTDALHPVDARRTRTPGVTVRSAPSSEHVAVVLNQHRQPFDDVRVRRGLAYGIDRATVAAAAEQPATVNQTAIPGRFGVRYSPFSHDPEGARDLLEQAGAATLDLELLVGEEHEAAAQAVADHWADLGVTVTVRVAGADALSAAAERGDFDALVRARDAGVDSHAVYYEDHHSAGAGNIQGYSSDEVDDLLEAARSEVDEDERDALLSEAIRTLVDEVSHLYLFNLDHVHAWQHGVSDYTVQPDGSLRFAAVRLFG
jgi:peptide/nickel transport system substrate-binding protein